MVFLIIQYTIISLLLICIFHYLYDFFKNNLTVPKVKDLVNKPASAYSEIYETIHKDISIVNLNSQLQKPIISNQINSNTYHSDENVSMKDELKKYLSKLNSGTTDINDLNTDNLGMSTNTTIRDWGNYSSLV